MKEILKILIAAFGCWPLLAVGLFLVGTFMGEFMGDVNIPTPPQWLLIPVILLPVFASFYIKAYSKHKKREQWLRRWPKAGLPEIVGSPGKHFFKTIEDVWLEEEMRHHPPVKNSIRTILDRTTLWGAATLMSVLALIYLCFWLGLTAAGR